MIKYFHISKGDFYRPSPKIKYSFIKILTGSDLSSRRLPLMTAVSKNKGPVIWLTACEHGDEVGGIVVIQEIFKRIRLMDLRRGAIYAFPLMNPMGFEMVSRDIAFSDEDLNRVFPGNKEGTLAERIAHKIFNTILETKPALVLDIHNDWTKSIPYIFLDPVQHNSAYEKTQALSKKTGFLVIRDPHELQGTLSYTFLNKNIPALTLELGEPFINEKNVEYGVRSIFNIMMELGMITRDISPFYYPMPDMYKEKILKYTEKPLSSTSGLIRFLVNPGDIVKKGQPVARIYNTFGRLQETIDAINNSIVLSLSDSAVAFPGMTLITFGFI